MRQVRVARSPSRSISRRTPIRPTRHDRRRCATLSGRAEVRPERRFAPGGLENVADHGRSRRLAVGAGDADEPRLGLGPREQFDIADDFDSGRPGARRPRMRRGVGMGGARAQHPAGAALGVGGGGILLAAGSEIVSCVLLCVHFPGRFESAIRAKSGVPISGTPRWCSDYRQLPGTGRQDLPGLNLI